MHISFSPAVDQTIPISVLSLSNSVQLHFAATLSSPEAYDEFKRNKIRIQVWSDIPARGRLAGEWGELSFEEQNSVNGNNSSVSLLPEDADKGSESNEHTLCLDCTVPLVGQTRFAYTYRLVYPSGEIRWLGQFGQNGTLVLERHDLLSLGEGWRLDDKLSGAYLWYNNGEPACVEVARLDWKDCSVWAMGPESSTNYLTEDSSVVFFVPRVRAGCVALPQTFVLSASHGSLISMTPLGGINFTPAGKGSLLLRMYGPTLDPQTFVDAIVSHSGICSPRLFNCAGSSHVVLTSPENVWPISTVVIPLSPVPSNPHVSVSLPHLFALLPSATDICIASRSQYRFYSSVVPPTDQTIEFVVNAAGGQFSLAPAYRLGSEGNAWHVSVLTPYKPATPPVEPENKLPTPPSSPELLPVIPQGTSPMLVPSLLDLNGTNSPPTPPPAQTAEVASPQTRSAIATQRNWGNGIMRCMRVIYTMAMVLLRSLMATIFPFLHISMVNETSDADEQTPLLREHASERLEHTPGLVDHTDANPVYTQTNVVDTVSGASLPSHDLRVKDAGPNDSSAHNSISVDVAEPSEHEPSPVDSPAESEPELRLSTPLFIDTPGGTVLAILRALRPSASIDEVGIELDGTIVDRIVEKLDEAIYSVKFRAGANGGKAKIFTEL